MTMTDWRAGFDFAWWFVVAAALVRLALAVAERLGGVPEGEDDFS